MLFGSSMTTSSSEASWLSVVKPTPDVALALQHALVDRAADAVYDDKVPEVEAG